ncbi:MAG: copper amine oxidase N-terminal domain-containing protein [Peptococcaceae bacterium]|jgi:hypothetical protein|nr:copper amine oxidase N-terminal domain-containing protein [Peptococcaceae bacterium]
MKDRSSWLKGFAAGLLAMFICAAGLGYASGAASEVTAYINEALHMTFNDVAFAPAEADGSLITPVLINNRTYLPLRAIAEKAGVHVNYNAATSEVILRNENELLTRANLVLHYLKYRDFAQLANLVHKDKGVTFSPYAYIENSSVRLSSARLNTLTLTDQFKWGSWDGSGDFIELNVAGYFDTFVFDKDYIQAPMIGVNTIVNTGNTISNLEGAFPGTQFVEFHIPGVDPQYGGIDWGSLRLVFESVDGEWMLVGIVHDQWTI